MFLIYLLDWHPFCIGIEPDSEAMICDNSMSFLSKDTYTMTNIIWTLVQLACQQLKIVKSFNSSFNSMWLDQ
jgi:hypothetical protein